MDLYKNEIINFLGENIGKFILLMNGAFIFTYMVVIALLTIQYGSLWKYSSFWFGLGYLTFFYLWADWLGNSILETSQNKVNDKNEG